MIRWLDKKIFYKNNPVKYYQKMGIKFGENCSITGDIYVTSEPYLISIGDNCRITDGVKFITHDGGVNVIRVLNDDNLLDIFGPISIGNNVFIGNNAIILPNVTIGDNVIIAAGAVVTRDVPSDSVVGGVPAKVLKTIDKYWEKNKERVERIRDYPQKEKREYLIKKYEQNI